MGLKDFFKKANKNQNAAKDPVCGMSINLETTKFKSTYKDKIFGFCSADCKATFDKNPEEYAD